MSFAYLSQPLSRTCSNHPKLPCPSAQSLIAVRSQPILPTSVNPPSRPLSSKHARHPIHMHPQSYQPRREPDLEKAGGFITTTYGDAHPSFPSPIVHAYICSTCRTKRPCTVRTEGHPWMDSTSHSLCGSPWNSASQRACIRARLPSFHTHAAKADGRFSTKVVGKCLEEDRHFYLPKSLVAVGSVQVLRDFISGFLWSISKVLFGAMRKHTDLWYEGLFCCRSQQDFHRGRTVNAAQPFVVLCIGIVMQRRAIAQREQSGMSNDCLGSLAEHHDTTRDCNVLQARSDKSCRRHSSYCAMSDFQVRDPDDIKIPS